MSKIITTTGQTDIDVSSSTPNQIVKVIKTADETVTNSAILQDDNELKFNVGANQTWLIDYTLIVTGIDTIADIKFHMTNPGGATAYWNPSAINDDGGASWSGRILGQSPAALLPIGTDIVCGTFGGTFGVKLTAIYTSVTAGEVCLQWAQQTQTAGDLKILAKSMLLATRLV